MRRNQAQQQHQLSEQQRQFSKQLHLMATQLQRVDLGNSPFAPASVHPPAAASHPGPRPWPVDPARTILEDPGNWPLDPACYPPTGPNHYSPRAPRDLSTSQAHPPPAYARTGNPDRYRNWRPATIGIFYPDAPLSLGHGEKFSRDNTTYYRNVHDLLRRLKNHIAINPGAPVQDNLDQLLQGEANTWFDCQLSLDTQRHILCAPHGLAMFLKRLKYRFGITPNQARRQLYAKRYRIRDV